MKGRESKPLRLSCKCGDSGEGCQHNYALGQRGAVALAASAGAELAVNVPAAKVLVVPLSVETVVIVVVAVFLVRVRKTVETQLGNGVAIGDAGIGSGRGFPAVYAAVDGEEVFVTFCESAGHGWHEITIDRQ